MTVLEAIVTVTRAQATSLICDTYEKFISEQVKNANYEGAIGIRDNRDDILKGSPKVKEVAEALEFLNNWQKERNGKDHSNDHSSDKGASND